MTACLSASPDSVRQRVESARRGLREKRLAHDVFDQPRRCRTVAGSAGESATSASTIASTGVCASASARARASTASSSPIRPSTSATVPASIGSSSRGDSRGAAIGSPIRARASIAGNARKKSPEVGDRDQPIDRRRVPVAADGFDRMKPHVDVRIVERRDQRLDSLGPALRAKRQCRLDAKIGIVISHQRHERVGDVDAGQRQQLQRAAQHAEIAMSVAQRRYDRVHERRVAPAGRALERPRRGPASRRRASALPIGPTPSVGSKVASCADRDDAFRRGALAQLARDAALGLEPRRHVLDCHHQAHRSVVIAQRADRRRAAACGRIRWTVRTGAQGIRYLCSAGASTCADPETSGSRKSSGEIRSARSGTSASAAGRRLGGGDARHRARARGPNS